MARPTKLTPTVREKILLALAAGCTRKHAAALAGISEDSFARYRAKDKKLAAAVVRAEAEAVVACCLAIRRAAEKGKWRAAAWWLERRCPEEWGRQRAFAPANPVEVNVHFYKPGDLDRLSTEDLRTLHTLADRCNGARNGTGSAKAEDRAALPSGHEPQKETKETRELARVRA